MTYHILSFLLKAISLLPFWVLYAFSDVLALLLYYIVRYRRRVVRRNLTECFPDKDLSEIKAIEHKFYRFFTDNILEACKMATISPESMSRHMVFTNIDQVNKRLREGRSISLFLGHYANWEWISSMPLHLYKGAISGQIYQRLRNKNMDRLMLHVRSRMGATNIEMRNTARFITSLVAQGKECIIGFIADQSPRYRDVHHFMPFLNHEAPVLVGTEKITKHYDFDAWFVKPTRVKRGYYTVEFVELAPDSKSLPDFELTALYYQHLEAMINECPYLYLWSHNRFKHARK
ncbi:MAG: lysophospholipid acyltransferase family protein [Clostridiales bacterium]|nr:lysophospholipid acyltransferase family protein [Clostridiales bacterium]